MNTFFSQFKKEAENIRLTPRERSAMRHALDAAMRPSPMKSPFRVVASPFLFFFSSPRLAPVVAFSLVVAVIGTTGVYAAEGAVPGEVLYPVKVNVNESVRAAIARTPEARAAWHAEAAERRMKEAEILAVRGTLTPQHKEELEERFDEHASLAEEALALVEEDDAVAAADISTRFESSIEAHSAVIARLAREGDSRESRDESKRFADALRSRIRTDTEEEPVVALSVARVESGVEVKTYARESDIAISATATLPPSDQAARAIIGKNASSTLEEVEERFAAIKDTLDKDVRERTENQIRRIKKLIEELRAHEEKGDADREALTKALKEVTTLNVFLEAQQEFKAERMLLPVPPFGEEDDGEREDGSEDEAPKGLPSL